MYLLFSVSLIVIPTLGPFFLQYLVCIVPLFFLSSIEGRLHNEQKEERLASSKKNCIFSFVHCGHIEKNFDSDGPLELEVPNLQKGKS